VVLLLVANILHHRAYVGLADAEGAVPACQAKAARCHVSCTHREEFDLITRSASATASAGGKRQETVYMVGPGVRVDQLTVNIADDPAHISEQVPAEVGCEERLAVLGRKDDMGEEVGKGVSHRLSPLWGSHILTQLLVPRLTPWAIPYRPSGPEMPSTRTVKCRNSRARLKSCPGALQLPVSHTRLKAAP